jgi:16S rRNA (uracil1498-N3)-methyltransferase
MVTGPRFFCPLPLSHIPMNQAWSLPTEVVKHIQVRRLQPLQTLVLWDGQGGQYLAKIVHMGRHEVQVELHAHDAFECELPRVIHWAFGCLASDRTDFLIEKATELGIQALWPLYTDHSSGPWSNEVARKKQAQWQAQVIQACTQCGRNRFPQVHLPLPLVQAWPLWQTQGLSCFHLSLGSMTLSEPPVQRQDQEKQEAIGMPLAQISQSSSPLCGLSGPEGGFSQAEESWLAAQGSQAVNLGPRVLRAETAPLVALARLSLPELR